MSVHEYEVTFIVNPTLGEEETVAVPERVVVAINSRGGVISDVSPWGKRRLAYPINHMREGSYVTVTFDMDTAREAELDPAINLIEPVVRHLVVRLDERKRARDQRARAAAPRAAAPQQQAATQAAAARPQTAEPVGVASAVEAASPAVTESDADEFVPPATLDADDAEEAL